MTGYGFDSNESVTFVTETRNLPIKQFKPRDLLSVGIDWEIEKEFRYFRIDNATGKKDAIWRRGHCIS